MRDAHPTTIDEQIKSLKANRLCLPDENHAKEFLLYNNYYRVTGYTLALRHNGVFNANTSFQDIEDIYNFDLELRHVLLKYLEIIETTVKSVYSYEAAHFLGPMGYLRSENFLDAKEYDKIMQKAKKQRDSRMAHEAYAPPFAKRREDIPIWAFVDFLTISDISFLYKISQRELKQRTAEAMNLRVKGDVLLEKFMHSMTILRNLCAHGCRLYDRLFKQKPSLNKKESALLIKDTDGTTGNARLYGFVIIMRWLLCAVSFAKLKTEIAALAKTYPAVNMGCCGFRADWQALL